jgi:hypothetical protein
VAELTVVFRKRTTGAEAERILDQLEIITGLHAEQVEGARRYNLDESKDVLIAMASIKGHLDAISGAWPTHLELDIE